MWNVSFLLLFIRHFEICLHAHSLTRPLSSFEIVFRLLGEAGWELLHKKSIRVRHNLYWEDWLRAYSRLSWEVASGGPRITWILWLQKIRVTRNFKKTILNYLRQKLILGNIIEVKAEIRMSGSYVIENRVSRAPLIWKRRRKKERGGPCTGYEFMMDISTP